VGQHGSASGSILLGLDGFEVTVAEVVDDEWRLAVQATATTVGCGGCGTQARLHARRTVEVRDLPIGGRPVVLAWRKRIWRCVEPACAVRTWTEQRTAIRPRAVLTCRARAEACRRVGKDAHAVAAVARDLGVGWATVMRAVTDHGTPLVEDPGRLDGVAALGLDETSFLKATRTAPTRYVTGLVDLEGGRLLDVVADRTRAAVHGWLDARSRGWLAQVATVALDPWRGDASALVAPLGHATVVVDHFHAIKLANAAVDQVRRRIQQATLGHRGRKPDPLYRIRKLLLTAAEQLTSRGWMRLRAGLAAGDPGGEVAVAWQGKELLRAVDAASDLAHAQAALERLLPLVGRRRGGGAVAAGSHRQGLGGRNPRLPRHRRLLQRAHRGHEPAGQVSMERPARVRESRGSPTAHRGRSHYRKEPAVMARIPQQGPIHLGLDVHRNTISIATLPPTCASAEVEQIPSDETAVLAFLGRFPEPARLRVCYEAGPTGYELARLLHRQGVACQVIAPSLIPRAAGDKARDRPTRLPPPGPATPRRRAGRHPHPHPSRGGGPGSVPRPR
jgi:transposase